MGSLTATNFASLPEMAKVTANMEPQKSQTSPMTVDVMSNCSEDDPAKEEARLNKLKEDTAKKPSETSKSGLAGIHSQRYAAESDRSRKSLSNMDCGYKTMLQLPIDHEDSESSLPCEPVSAVTHFVESPVLFTNCDIELPSKLAW